MLSVLRSFNCIAAQDSRDHVGLVLDVLLKDARTKTHLCPAEFFTKLKDTLRLDQPDFVGQVETSARGRAEHIILREPYAFKAQQIFEAYFDADFWGSSQAMKEDLRQIPRDVLRLRFSDHGGHITSPATICRDGMAAWRQKAEVVNLAQWRADHAQDIGAEHSFPDAAVATLS